jgi:hypothetical protein
MPCCGGLKERTIAAAEPVSGESRLKLQNDPHFRDHLLFYEYFHGDTARGVGAAHQTGWTGLVAKLLMPRRRESQPHPKDN